MTRTPLSIPGALRWTVAEDAGVADGERVVSLVDRVSGSVYEPMIAGGTGPLYIASDSRLGGRATLSFDATRAAALRETLDLTVPSSGFTVWAALLRTGGASNAVAYAADDSSTTTNGTRLFQLSWNNSSQPRFVSFGDNASTRLSNGASIALNSPLALTGIADRTLGKCHVNGNNPAGNSSGSTGSLTPPRRTTLGGAVQNNSNYAYGGVIAAVGAYDHPLTSDERALLHSYLQDTYGMQVADYTPEASPWSRWDGSVENPLSLEGVWDGSAVRPATVERV